MGTPLDRVRAEKLPPEAWEKELRAISPISTKFSHLRLRWHPANIWVLYECVPAELIPPSKLEQLTDRPYWELPPGQRLGRMVSVSAYQFWMYQQHKVWARPFWFIQGNNGGTPARLSDYEAAMAKAAGFPTDVPAPGELPYAPFDQRVVQQIVARDRLWKMGMSVEALQHSATSGALKAEEAEAERKFRKDFLSWWEGQMAAGSDFLAWYTSKTEADMTLRKATKAEVNAAAQLKDSYIETGVVPSAVEV